MPQMGVSVSEGTITKWLKREGEAIAADEPLLEISTDKVDTEVPSPGEGIVQQILVQEGETVEVGTKLAVIAPEGAGAAQAADERAPAGQASSEQISEPATAQAAAQANASASEGTTPTAASTDEARPAEASTAETTPPAPDNGRQDERSFVSPVVARIASEHNVDVGQIQGTGRGGRVTKKDILAFIDSGAAAPESMDAEPATPVGREAGFAGGGCASRGSGAGAPA